MTLSNGKIHSFQLDDDDNKEDLRPHPYPMVPIVRNYKESRPNQLPRTLMKLDSKIHGTYELMIYTLVKEKLSHVFRIDERIINMGNPQWVGAMQAKYKKAKYSNGLEHRDTEDTKNSYTYTAIIFLSENSESLPNLPATRTATRNGTKKASTSGAIKFFLGSEQYMPELAWPNSEETNSEENLAKHENARLHLRRNLEREVITEKFEEVIIMPKLYKMIIFDSRIIHQSLAHLDEHNQRLALAFQITIGKDKIIPLPKDWTELDKCCYDSTVHMAAKTSKKRKQKGQGKVQTATKKRRSAKNT